MINSMTESVAVETNTMQHEQETQLAQIPRIETTYINYDLDIDSLSPKKRELLNKIQEFARDTAERYREKMGELMTYYAKDIEQDVFTPEIIEKMKKRGHDLPRFTVYDGESAKKFLQNNFPEIDPKDRVLDENSFLVVFNLPKPLARFWHRGGLNSWGEKSEKVKKVGKGEIEWGHLYREGMPVIWDQMDNYDLGFTRINDYGQHDPKKYYYVWVVSERQVEEYYWDHKNDFEEDRELEY